MSLDIKKRYKKIAYTLKHKKAFLKVEKQLRGKNTLRGYFHDIDKPFMYLALWIRVEDVSKIHRQNSYHHLENNLDKTREDLIDMIIDWECARLTKPDKPLNAYQTLMRYYPEYQKDFIPLIKELLPEQIVRSNLIAKPKIANANSSQNMVYKANNYFCAKPITIKQSNFER